MIEYVQRLSTLEAAVAGVVAWKFECIVSGTRGTVKSCTDVISLTSTLDGNCGAQWTGMGRWAPVCATVLREARGRAVFALGTRLDHAAYTVVAWCADPLSCTRFIVNTPTNRIVATTYKKQSDPANQPTNNTIKTIQTIRKGAKYK